MVSLARFCTRHRLAVVVAWVLAVIALGAAAQVTGARYANNFTLPRTESAQAIALLQREFPVASGGTGTLVIATPGRSVTDPAVRAAVEPLLARIARVPHVAAIGSPYAAGGASQISRDGRIAFATINFDQMLQKLPHSSIATVQREAAAARAPGLDIETTGQVFSAKISAGVSVIVGVVAAAVVLFVAFGSALATLLPLLTAGLALGAGVSGITLLTHVLDVADFGPELAILIGLGVGVDYALFIVTRHRQNLEQGAAVPASIARAVDTSGRAVLFAGITVCIALLGMFALRVSFLYGVAVAASLAVAFTMLASLTLLPALLSYFGSHVLSRRERRRLAAGGAARPEASGRWASWSRLVQRRPLIAAVVAAVLMLVLAVPTLSLRLGSSDQGNDPPGSTTRAGYELLAQGFGPGFNGPLTLVAETPDGTARAAVATLPQRLRTVPDVASVGPVVPSRDGRAALLTVYPGSSPQAQATSTLLQTLRSRVLPEAVRGTGAVVYVGGVTAAYTDFAAVLSGGLPGFIGAVVVLSFLLLLCVFRSVVIPLKAAVMNLLSIAAAFGVVVAVFQWGWAMHLIGVSRAGPIDAWIPVMLFAILFGLSMDYEVFLVSRMQEEWLRTRDNQEAVTTGLATTGRTITAAATIMVLVFLSFALSDTRVLKLFGLGLAVAVLLDALVIRTLLVPALMQLFGRWNWWVPRWLDRVLPHISVEGHTAEPLAADGKRQPAGQA
ncbi:MAG TPA: MMPL family transporter [Frankiaceae bacterium]